MPLITTSHFVSERDSMVRAWLVVGVGEVEELTKFGRSEKVLVDWWQRPTAGEKPDAILVMWPVRALHFPSGGASHFC